jgi:hypothetical protein
MNKYIRYSKMPIAKRVPIKILCLLYRLYFMKSSLNDLVVYLKEYQKNEKIFKKVAYNQKETLSEKKSGRRIQNKGRFRMGTLPVYSITFYVNFARCGV